jgi:hypothetical protein
MPTSLARTVFLAALVGMAAEDKARLVEHLKSQEVDGQALASAEVYSPAHS